MKHIDIPVVYIITKLELGGAQKICLSLFSNIARTHQTYLITGTDGPLINQVKHHPNVFLLTMLKREVGIQNLAQELFCFFKIIRILRMIKKKHGQIIVHTHSTKAGFLGRWAAFFANVKPRIHTVHGFAFHAHQPSAIRYTIIILEWLTSLITTKFICVSSYDAQMGSSLFPRFKKKHTLIRAAVNEQQFFLPAQHIPQFPTAYGPFTFGTVSCFKKQKNLFDLLKAFAYTHKNNPLTRLEIIGDGELRNEIKQWIKEHNLQSMIKLHGWQSHVVPIMLHWHAFVLSSLWEGLPCAIVEARMLKLPVLSYHTGGISDVISPKKNGMLFAQKDWQALAIGMLKLSKQQRLYKKLATFKQDLSEFSMKHMIRQHNKLYAAYKIDKNSTFIL